jgi:type IV pilus assembly protein PilA
MGTASVHHSSMGCCEAHVAPLLSRRGFRAAIDMRGVSILELLVVVAVIGILATLFAPAYGNYTRRVWVAEGLLIAGAAKAAVAEEAMTGGSGSGGSQDNELQVQSSIHEVIAVEPNRMIDSVKRAGNIIVINFTEAFSGGISKVSLPLVGTLQEGGMTWRCLTGPEASAALAQASVYGIAVGVPLIGDWVPAECR